MNFRSLINCVATASLVYNVNAVQKEETTILPSSCVNLEDGYHWIKMIDDDDYTPVYQKCSNGYIVLDYSVDNNIADYFDTWSMWHVNTAGPTNDVHINWENWYLPNSGETSFLVSPSCSACEEDHKRQIYESATSYYMTGTLFGCFWEVKGQHNCDVDWDTDTCYSCSSNVVSDASQRIEIGDDSDASDWTSTGICPHIVMSSSAWIATSHDNCTHEVDESNVSGHKQTHLQVKPSIGVNGDFCVCAKPSKDTEYFEVTTKDMPTEPVVKEEEELLEPTTYYLTQKDFKYGTYRIKNPGTYIVTEDITFDFNRDDDFLPKEDQAEDYPGAGDYRDAYFLGFFAGITIETNDVTLDLNGHTLEMSEHFYYQQRWFTTIELTTQYFLPGQGIGNFGAQPKVAENCIIKNGVLGLSSHHGIHGNYNKNILIENVQVKEFETHGIQFNGFDGIKLTNVEVGPTSNKAFFTGEYGHMRILLNRFKKIAEETVGETIQFYGREHPISMQDIADEIEKQMKFAKDYVFEGKTISKDDEEYNAFKSALKLFVNEDGIPNGAAQYGIFLNTFGASIFTYNLYSGFYSTNAYLENVKIHGMRHELDEYVRLHRYATGDIFLNPFNAPLDAESMFESLTDFSDPKYKGDIITDAYIASNLLSENFNYLGVQIILNDVMGKWAQGENFFDAMGTNEGEISIGCNSDVMIHSGKGINGLRLDGVSGVTVKNLQVYDIVDSTPLGKETCGEYDVFISGESGGHFRQTSPMQVGFSGNMAQAINLDAAIDITFENIDIRDIYSETGPAFGISVWPSCDITLKGDINVKNLGAGTKVEKGTYTYQSRPNKAPETCAVRPYYQYQQYSTSVNYDEARFNTECISGHIGCMGSSVERTLLGETTNACSDPSYDMSFISDNSNDYKVGAVNNDNNHREENTVGFKYLPEQTMSNVGLEIAALLSLVGLVGYYKYKGSTTKTTSYKLIDNVESYGTC